MSERIPDVHDPDIRAMVLRDHEPEEFWSMSGELVGVHCCVCGKPWPCMSIEAARALLPEADEWKVGPDPAYDDGTNQGESPEADDGD